MRANLQLLTKGSTIGEDLFERRYCVLHIGRRQREKR